MTPDEIKAFWLLLDGTELGGLSLHVRLLFKFALATGRRTDEVRRCTSMRSSISTVRTRACSSRPSASKSARRL